MMNTECTKSSHFNIYDLIFMKLPRLILFWILAGGNRIIFKFNFKIIYSNSQLLSILRCPLL